MSFYIASHWRSSANDVSLLWRPSPWLMCKIKVECSLAMFFDIIWCPLGELYVLMLIKTTRWNCRVYLYTHYENGDWEGHFITPHACTLYLTIQAKKRISYNTEVDYMYFGNWNRTAIDPNLLTNTYKFEKSTTLSHDHWNCSQTLC